MLINAELSCIYKYVEERRIFEGMYREEINNWLRKYEYVIWSLLITVCLAFTGKNFNDWLNLKPQDPYAKQVLVTLEMLEQVKISEVLNQMGLVKSEQLKEEIQGEEIESSLVEEEEEWLTKEKFYLYFKDIAFVEDSLLEGFSNGQYSCYSSHSKCGGR